jgi:hypothetical protein
MSIQPSFQVPFTKPEMLANAVSLQAPATPTVVHGEFRHSQLFRYLDN